MVNFDMVTAVNNRKMVCVCSNQLRISVKNSKKKETICKRFSEKREKKQRRWYALKRVSYWVDWYWIINLGVFANNLNVRWVFEWDIEIESINGGKRNERIWERESETGEVKGGNEKEPWNWTSNIWDGRVDLLHSSILSESFIWFTCCGSIIMVLWSRYNLFQWELRTHVHTHTHTRALAKKGTQPDNLNTYYISIYKIIII